MINTSAKIANLESTKKNHAMNAAFIRILLALFIMTLFGFAPLGLPKSQTNFIIASVGFSFLGNILSVYYIYKGNISTGIIISILSFNVSFIGVSYVFDNFGSITFFLILIPSVILTLSFLSNKVKYGILFLNAILAATAIFIDYSIGLGDYRIILNSNTQQLVTISYSIFIFITSALYLRNWYSYLKDSLIEEKVQSILILVAISIISLFILFALFINNYAYKIQFENKLSNTNQNIQETINNFLIEESLVVEEIAKSKLFESYLDKSFLNKISQEEQQTIESVLDMIKTETGILDNGFVASVLDQTGNVLSISDHAKRNSFQPETFFTTDMLYNRKITNVTFSTNPEIAYIYITSPINSRLYDGVLIYAYDVSILQSLIESKTLFPSENYYSILYDENLIQLAHGANANYQMTIANLISDEKTQILENELRISPLLTKESYPYNPELVSFLEVAQEIEGNVIFKNIYEGKNLATEYIVGSQTIDVVGKTWQVASFVPYQDYLDSFENSSIMLFLSGLMLMIIASILSISYSSVFSKPIIKLIDSISGYSESNKYNSPNLMYNDEIKELGAHFEELTERIDVIVNGLEYEIENRTSDLNFRLNQIQISSKITKNISPITNNQELLKIAVNEIQDEFKFYYVGIYFIKNNYANLVVGTGEEGYLLEKADHRLSLNSAVPISESIRANLPIISSLHDIQMHHPLLPHSRDELVIPIHMANQIVGALDVHSLTPNSFSKEDFPVFENLAEQIGTAFLKNEQYTEIKINLDDLNSAYKNVLREAWEQFKFSGAISKGYGYKNFTHHTITTDNEVCQLAWQLKRPVFSNNHQALRFVYPNAIALPIFVRDEIISVLEVSFDNEEALEQNLPVIKTIVERLGLILDNMRLTETSQKSVQLEYLSNQIAGQLHQTTEVNSILQRVTEELGKTFDIAEVEVQLNSNIAEQTRDNDGETYEE